MTKKEVSLEHIANVQSKMILVGCVHMINTRILNYNHNDCIKSFKGNIWSMLKESHFFDNAPFKFINMCYRFGIEHGRIELGGINKTYFDLSTTIELQYDEVEYYSWNDVAKLCQLMEASMLDMIIYVGAKYNLPTKVFEERFKEIGGYPELPDDYQEKLPPSANRPTAEEIEEEMKFADNKRRTSRIKRGRDPRGRIALKPIPKYEQFQKKRYQA
jgi:hypothetical protein